MYKRNYHPLVILLYASGMLDSVQIRQLPKTTKYNWNQFSHENYYGTDWVKNYIDQFDNIKEVFASAFLYKSLRFLVETRKGYLYMLQEFSHNKQLLKLHANKIITSIDKMKSLANVNVKIACKYYGISKDWYYHQKRKLICNISPIKKCYRQHPSQLTIPEMSVIQNLVTDPINFGKTKTTLYYHALRNKLLFCGKSTFNKYASAFGYKKVKRFKYSKPKGFRASRVFEWLHVDITNVNTLED